jgi:hypothetical protein
VSKISKEEKLSEYERDYLERLATKGKIKSMQKEEPVISEEERTRKLEDAEKIQIESAQQVQEASAAKVQLELDIKNKHEFLNKELISLMNELKVLKAQLEKEPVKRKITKKKAAPKRKITKKKAAPKRKITKKKAAPKRK